MLTQLCQVDQEHKEPPTWNSLIKASVLDHLVGDSLIIIDSCAAAIAALRSLKHGYLFASAFESTTTTAVNNSFTRRLIDLLRSNNGSDITVAQIHAKLMENAGEPHNYLNGNRQSPCVPLWEKPKNHVPLGLVIQIQGESHSFSETARELWTSGHRELAALVG